ncbi:hypothetical protein SEUCBS139899_001008 [Sporothrix eucalyptigena]
MPAATESPAETPVSHGLGIPASIPASIPAKESKQQPAHAMFTTTSYPSRALHFLGQVPDEHFMGGTAKFAANGNANGVAKHVVSEDVAPGLLKLDILVVGAGLGGLATAIALRRRGFSVQVFEQAPKLGEIGAGIQIPPNSGRLLRRWGVMKHLQEQAVQPDGISFRRWATGEKIGFTDLTGDFVDVYEEPYYVVHRAHYHSALYERAKELGVKIRLNSRVCKYDPDKATITLTDGNVFQGDFIVAADGIKSIARDTVHGGSQAEPKPTGFAAYRATVDVEKMKKIPELNWILEKPCLNVWIGKNCHVMTYTIAGGNSFNLVLSHYDPSDPKDWPKMSLETVLSNMRREFEDWDPELRHIIGLIDHALKWPLIGGNHLDTWTAPSNRLIIIGDAAHAMLPYMSQGAAMAIEDGAALAQVLGKIRSVRELPFALRVFSAERKKRAGQMQEASAVNSMIWHFADGPLQQARDAAMRPEVEQRHFLTSANQWSDPITQAWAYGYDAEAAVQAAWDAAVTDLIMKSA